jgi:hypothetical protein
MRPCFATVVSEDSSWFGCVFDTPCLECDRYFLALEDDLVCNFCDLVNSKPRGKEVTSWVRERYMQDYDEIQLALRLLPMPIWEEIETEIFIPFKPWKESMLATAPKNTDGTTPSLIEMWRRDAEGQSVAIDAMSAEIERILTRSAGAEAFAAGAHIFTLQSRTRPRCT